MNIYKTSFSKKNFKKEKIEDKIKQKDKDKKEKDKTPIFLGLRVLVC